MNKLTQFLGIDLCRGLAAFAVILVHSGDETWGIPIEDKAIQFRHLFYFAVPFFLATSFYFANKNLPLNITKSFWHKKFKRIMVPYFVWSAFYIVVKLIVFSAANDNEQISQLLSDPLAIAFFGGASYHLYFMPLLFAGTLSLCFVNYIIEKKNSTNWFIFCSLIGVVIYQLLLVTNNSFNLGSGIAFPGLLQLISSANWSYSILRIILVNIAWILRCLPYLFTAMLINQMFKRTNCTWLYQKQIAFLLFYVFLITNTIGKNFLPSAVSEIVIAYSLLLFGISISKHLKVNALIQNLGLCSFGIYLIHPFIKSAIEIILIKILPQLTQSVSIASILVYSTSSFLISWMLVSFLIKNKLFSQYI